MKSQNLTIDFMFSVFLMLTITLGSYLIIYNNFSKLKEDISKENWYMYRLYLTEKRLDLFPLLNKNIYANLTYLYLSRDLYVETRQEIYLKNTQIYIYP